MISEVHADTITEVSAALAGLDVFVTGDAAEALSALAGNQTVLLVPPPAVSVTTFSNWQCTFELWALATTIDPNESTATIAPILEALVPLGVTEASPDQFETSSAAFAGYRITLQNTYSKE